MNQKYELGKELFLNGMSITKISKELKISRAWFGKYLQKEDIDTKSNPITHQYNRSYVKQINSEEKAYWLGFILADGCINELFSKSGKFKGMTLEVTLKEEDKEHLLKLCDALEAARNMVKEKPVKLNGQTFIAYRLTLSSTPLCRDLIKHGVTPRKSFSAYIPDEIIKGPYVRHFIRGFFDGDGHIIFNKTHNYGLIFTSASPKILIQLKTIFLNLGVNDVALQTRNFTTHSLRFENKMSDEIILNYMYDEASIYLTRKYETYNARLYRNVGGIGGKYGEVLQKIG